MKGTAYVNIRSGASGKSASWAGYITKRASVTSGISGLRQRHLPDHLAEAAQQGFRSFRRGLRAHARGRQQIEIASHGNRSGNPRTHYRIEVSFPTRQIDQADALDEVQAWLGEHFPEMPTLSAAHRDTDRLHIHVWGDARQTSGKKVQISNGAFAEARKDWGQRHARLMAETEKKTRGLTDEQAAEREKRLADADARKLDEARTYRRERAKHLADAASGEMGRMLDAKRRERNGGLPEKPARIGERAEGGAVFRTRDRRAARQERERQQADKAEINAAIGKAEKQQQEEETTPAEKTPAEKRFLAWAKEEIAPLVQQAEGKAELELRLRKHNTRMILDESAEGGATVEPITYRNHGSAGASADLAELGTSVDELRARFGVPLREKRPKMPTTAEQAIRKNQNQTPQRDADRLGRRERESRSGQQRERGAESRGLSA